MAGSASKNLYQALKGNKDPANWRGADGEEGAGAAGGGRSRVNAAGAIGVELLEHLLSIAAETCQEMLKAAQRRAPRVLHDMPVLFALLQQCHHPVQALAFLTQGELFDSYWRAAFKAPPNLVYFKVLGLVL